MFNVISAIICWLRGSYRSSSRPLAEFRTNMENILDASFSLTPHWSAIWFRRVYIPVYTKINKIAVIGSNASHSVSPKFMGHCVGKEFFDRL